MIVADSDRGEQGGLQVLQGGGGGAVSNGQMPVAPVAGTEARHPNACNGQDARCFRRPRQARPLPVK